ncbi:hypothetical protein ACU8OJ_03815 [Rhizobium leguminosarum]
MQVSEKSITQMGYKRQESRPFLVFIARPLILRNFRAQNRAVPLLKLRLPGFTQSRTENRCALFLELLSLVSQFRTENRCALFLELLSLVSRNSGRKTAAHFSWNYCLWFRNSGRKTAAHFSWNCCLGFTQFRTENRCALFLELL